MRDLQRERVYQAEFRLREILDRQYDFPTIEIAGSTLVVPLEQKFADLLSMQCYVSALAPGVRVRERKGQARAHYHDGEIAIPTIRRWAMREVVLLHEIAHHRTRGDAHGPRFVGEFIELLSDLIGPEAGLLFRIFINDHDAKEA